MLEAAFRGSPDGMLVLDESGRILAANPAGRQIMGKEPGAMADFPVDSFREDGELLMNFGGSGDRRRTCEARFSEIQWEGRDCTLLILRDVTDRERAQRALRRSEAKLRAIYENAPLGIGLANLEGTVLAVNPRLAAMYEAPPAVLEGMLVLDLVHPDDRLRVAEAMTRAARTGEGFSVEMRMLRLDGSIFESKVDATVVVNTKGEPTFLLGMVEDISARRRTETELTLYRQGLETMVGQRTQALHSALREAESARESLDTILRSAPDGLLVIDDLDTVLMLNAAAEKLLGVRSADVVGGHVYGAVPDRAVRNLLTRGLRQVRQDAAVSFDFTTRAEESGEAILQAVLAPVRDAAGRRTGLVVILRDVTWERNLDRTKTEFMSTAAHELRTPLTSILGFSELLLTREDLSEEERADFLGFIHEQSAHLSNLVNDLLDVARLESGRGYALALAPCDLAQVIRRKAGLYARQHPRFSFRLDLAEPLPLAADPERLEQVVENILSNAVKYSPRGGEITVTAWGDGGTVRASFADQGMGMTPEQAERMYERFYRADHSNTAITGTGLGMSIVRNIMEAHQGRVWATSSPGRGTTVHLEFPAPDAEALPAHLPAANAATWSRT